MIRQFRLELGRLLQNPGARLAVLLTLLAPLAGLTVYRPLYSNSETDYATTMQGMFLANPALAGGLLGAVIFALLTVVTLEQLRRGGRETLIYGVISPLTAALTRLVALLCLSALAQAAAMLVWLPFTVYKLGAVFDRESYCLMYLVFMYGPIPLAILLSSAAYQLTRRLELALLLCAALAALSLMVWAGEWQLCWLNPCVWGVSDDFSNYRILRSVAYMRLTWLVGLAGAWGFSYLGVRQYGKGLLGSLLVNIRRVYRPLLTAALLAGGGWLYIYQPFVDHSNAEMNFEFVYASEYLDFVTCSSRYTEVRPDPKTGRVYGSAQFQLQNTSGQQQNVRFLINPGYEISSVLANGQEAAFIMEAEQEINEKAFVVTVPADREIELVIDYGGLPQEWNIIGDSQGGLEISDVYMCLENSCLAPFPYAVGYQGETLPNVVDITLPGNIEPILFGLGSCQLLRENVDGTRTWQLSKNGYNMIIYAGDYIREEIPVAAAGVTVNFYYSRKHQPIMEAMNASEAIRQTVEYCTEHIGPLDFYAEGSFNLIESRISGGGYAGGGASLADEWDFTWQNLADSAKGGSPAQTTIHELVHQWWGLGNMFEQLSEQEAWSAEGLTCYTTYRIVKALYGEAAAQTAYIDQWQAAVENYYQNFYVRHPEYLPALPEQYQASIANSLRSVQRYSEMPLKILKAERLVGGEAAMDEILAGLFGREIDPEYPYLTYQDFLNACQLQEEDLQID